MQRISQQFASSFRVFVAGNSIRYAYIRAKEAIASEIRMHVKPPHQAMATRKTTCSICLDDDVDANQMFCVDICRHQFCFECMKRHVEVRLLEGSVIRCPHYRCKSKLTFETPWHSDLSCDDYKRLGPNPTNDDDIKFKALANRNMWRQCGKCKNMIERSEGCIKVTCRCGHKFCYQCGAKAGGCYHGGLHIYPPTP
ncbi:unnamed protein product [Arabidopsis lyrata]|uniref:RBR-type E3 ubiquitin transferase n=1 Tax=Arabidopsis lyrata subsp. lyrata TaxID=81972 RepID=D7LMM8_ARALL|nr:hypothetical protein ARALYDRAFT_905705 [Arabidopsis lyrata subsp. lyrata]CAH8267524.1 unnamed protein product [Arabidopsis lyrata]